MTIHLDEEQLAAAIDAAVNVPVLNDVTEKRLFDLGVRAASDAVAQMIGKTLAKYGVTVTGD